ncbi:MAG: ADOP family duplicated permease [Terriglobia bacterium]
MIFLRSFVYRLRGAFSQRRFETRLDEEMQAHFELLVEENLAKGMRPQDAHDAARRTFGGAALAKEGCRDQRSWPFLDGLAQDLRYALRQVRHNRGFAAAAILVFALGIGANTAMFTVVDAVLLRPLPFSHPGRLVMVWRSDLKSTPGKGTVSYPDFLDYRKQNHVFDYMAAFRGGVDFTLTGGEQAARLHGAIVSADLLQLLGVKPILGRDFTPAEDKPSASGFPVVLSHHAWESEFGSDPKIIGRSITLNREPFTVVGVMAAGVQFPIQTQPVDLWTTMAYDVVHMNRPSHSTTDRGWRYLWSVARLRPGVGAHTAQAEVHTIAQRLATQYPSQDGHDGIWLQPLSEAVAGDLRPVLLALLGAVGCVLLIACVDMANLSLGRLAARRQEMAVRATLGAGRRRLARQLLTESTLLSVAGGGLGFLIAATVTPVLIRLSPHEIPRIDSVQPLQVDWRVFVFALALAVFTGLASGLAPAFQVWRAPLAESIKGGWRGLTASPGSARLRQSLVVVELALSAILLVGAGLLIRSMWRLVHSDPGFNPRNALTFKIDLPESTYTPAHQMQFFQQLLERVRALPGVQGAGGADFFPFSGVEFTDSFKIAGAAPNAENHGGAAFCLVTTEYFRAMGIPIFTGRAFNDSDRLGSLPVVVVSRSLADRYFGGQNPIGQRLILDSPVQIAGVAADVRNGDLESASYPTIYIPLAQQPAGFPKFPMTLIVRSRSNPDSLVPSIRSAVRALDKNVPVYDARPLAEYMSISEAQSRFNATLLAVFAGLGLVLASAGLYGVTSYAVAQRTHEIGIRMALGAERRDILRMILSQGMRLALAGVILGLAGARALTRLLRSFLFGVRPADPATFIIVASILVLVLLLSTFLPARRALRVDPLVALRHE